MTDKKLNRANKLSIYIRKLENFVSGSRGFKNHEFSLRIQNGVKPEIDSSGMSDDFKKRLKKILIDEFREELEKAEKEYAKI